MANDPHFSGAQFAPSSFGNASSQYYQSSQMHAPIGPVGGQPWLFGGQGGPLVNSLQQPGQQPSVASAVPFAPSSFGNASSQYYQSSQMHAPVDPVGGQPWLFGHGGPLVIPLQQPAFEVPAVYLRQSLSDWQEHSSQDGRKYYFNYKTRQSSWEKPLELMTLIERADASTVWKEFTAEDGRKYYYNKVTKQSKWTIPNDLKVAREQAEKAAAEGTQSATNTTRATNDVPAALVARFSMLNL